MQEALMLFESIANSQWFLKSALILFLNKIDLFKKKLASSPIPYYFPDFVGDHTDPKVAAKFFQAKFKGLNRRTSKVRAVPSLEFQHFIDYSACRIFTHTSRTRRTRIC